MLTEDMPGSITALWSHPAGAGSVPSVFLCTSLKMSLLAYGELTCHGGTTAGLQRLGSQPDSSAFAAPAFAGPTQHLQKLQFRLRLDLPEQRLSWSVTAM